jgi:hypothetical protein
MEKTLYGAARKALRQPWTPFFRRPENIPRKKAAPA